MVRLFSQEGLTWTPKEQKECDYHADQVQTEGDHCTHSDAEESLSSQEKGDDGDESATDSDDVYEIFEHLSPLL